jgi:hypothetical protein
MLIIVRSIALLSAISACVAASLADSLWSFVRWFFLTIAIQISCYNIYRQLVALMAKKITNDRIKEYTKQGVEVVCPCARAIKNLIPIQLNTDNSYKCLDCNKNVAVKIDVNTFLETQPVDLEQSAAALDQVYTTVTQQNIDGNQIS